MLIPSPLDFRPPLLLRNRHAQTVYAGLFRPFPEVAYTRERLETADGDFLDLDWSRQGSDRLVVVLHGLEGSSDRPYIRGLVKIMNDAGWDGVALNFRGCSGEANRLARAYHSGETGDLGMVLERIITREHYQSISLVGFSLGGNVTLKYVGEQGSHIHPRIRSAVGVSVPVDLESSSLELGRWYNRPYLWRFLKSLKAKTFAKKDILPNNINLEAVQAARDFREFDDAVTAPVHGFVDAVDYWTRSSSKPFLRKIRIPTLLINAADDSFLSSLCYPEEIARENPHFSLEIPRWGGHVGFVQFNAAGYYWSEQRIRSFLTETA